MEKKLSVLVTSLAIFLFLIFGIVYADTNGVWHRSEDVRVGTFGNDEDDSSSNYNFINPVEFNKNINIKQNVNITGTLEVTTIKSNSGSGSVIIQLG